MDNSANSHQATPGETAAGGAPLGKYGKFPASGDAKDGKSRSRAGQKPNGADRREDYKQALKSRLLQEEEHDLYATLSDIDRAGAHDCSASMRFALQSQARFWAPAGKHPLKRCHRFLIPAAAANPIAIKTNNPMFGQQVEVWRQNNGKSAHYRGLETCKSVWSCPVCSSRLMESRTQKLQEIVSKHTAELGTLLHLTLTVPHARADDVRDLVKKLAAAYNLLGEGRAYKKFRKQFTVGDVRAMEVTWGQKNGFHPHYHILIFLRPGVEINSGVQQPLSENGFWFDDRPTISLTHLQDFILSAWQSAAFRAGLGEPSAEHGVKLTTAYSQEQLLAQYIAKFHHDPKGPLWGAEAEMVKAHAKIGGEDRFHPMDFLRAGMLRDTRLNWKALWTDYSDGFRGQQQLRGISKLAKAYDVQMKSDEEEFEDVPDELQFVLLANLDRAEWSAVLRCGARGLLIEQSRIGSEQGLRKVVQICMDLSADLERKRLSAKARPKTPAQLAFEINRLDAVERRKKSPNSLKPLTDAELHQHHREIEFRLQVETEKAAVDRL